MPLKTKLGIGLGATIVGAGGIIGGLLGTRSGGSNPEANNNGGVAAVSPTKTEAPPTPTFTVEPSKTPSPTETPTVTPTPEAPVASGGRYAAIEDLPVSDAEKEAIRELTKDCDPKQMIIEKNGIVCLQTAIETRPTTINLDGDKVPANQFITLGLDKKNFPNADDMLETFFEQEKYYAWVNQSENTNVTFEQWEAQKNGGHPYEVWAWNGLSDEKEYTDLNDETFLIHKFVADGSRTDMIQNTAQQFSTEVIGNVANVNIFATDPTYFGETNPDGGDDSQLGVIFTLDTAANSLGIKPPHIYLTGQKYSIFAQSQMPGFVVSDRTMMKTIMPSYDFYNPPAWKPGVFIVTGTKYQK